MIQRRTTVRATKTLVPLVLRALLVLQATVILTAAMPGPAHADEPIRPDLWGVDGSVWAVLVSGDTLYIGGEFDRVLPYTGSWVPLDTATGSLALDTFPKVYGSGVIDVVPDGSGGWYIGGEFDEVGGLARQSVAHILADYTVDPAWDPGADGRVYDLALSADGSIVYAGGEFTNIGGQPRNRIAALDAVTGLATGWDPDANELVVALAVHNGTVYAGGEFTDIGGQTRGRIAALDANTNTNNATAWNPDADKPVYTLALSGDGSTVYAGGIFSTIGGQPRSNIAALDANTNTNNATAWNPNASNPVIDLALSGDGSTVYAGGFFNTIGGQPRNHIAALDANTNTNNATDWNPNADQPVYTLALSGDGSTVYAGGYFETVGGQPRNHIAALDANVNTNNATAWNPNADDHVYTLALSADGSTIYAGGELQSINMVARNNIAALDLTTGRPTPWDPDANEIIYALALSADGSTVYAGGWFTNIGGQTRRYIAALDAASGEATDWNPDPDEHIYTLALSADGSTVYAGGEFTNIGGADRSHIAALDAASGEATWDHDADAFVLTLALSADGGTLYAGGGFSNIGGQTRHNIAALDPATGAATTWNPDVDNMVRVLAPSGDGSTVYAGGSFQSIGGQTRRYIAALDAATGAATAWDPNADDDVEALALSRDGSTVYAGGIFETIGWPARQHIAALDAATGQATAWNPNAEDDVQALALGGDVIYAGGYFNEMGGQPALSLAGILLPGKIIIEKETKPGGGSGFNFSQDIDGTGDFSLDDGQSKAFSGVTSGQYTITEEDPRETPGRHELTGLVCEDSDPGGLASTTDLENRTATVNVSPGETVRCTFTNTQRGKIIVEKVTEPAGHPDSFSFSGHIEAELGHGQSETRGVRPGTYTVREALPEGWDLTDITCDDSNSGGDLATATATYRVRAGETVRCTFTNTRRATITIENQTIPPGVEQAFSFSGEISAQLKDDQRASKEVVPGAYQVTENVPAGWELHMVFCTNAASLGDTTTGTATLQARPGEEVTCTFANVRDDVLELPATLVVAQETTPDGDATLFTFQGDAQGTIADGQRIVVTGLEAGTYTSRELVPDGWTLTGIACDDTDSSGDLASATATFRLQPDEVVICTFYVNRLNAHPVYLPLVLR